MNRARVKALLLELLEAVEEPTGEKNYAALAKAQRRAAQQEPEMPSLVRERALRDLRGKGLEV